jgi:diguanylate cyclase (GGDEF)-like protein
LLLLKKFFQKPDLLPLASLIFGALFWLMDSTVDFCFFNEDKLTFQATLISSEPMDLWMRSLVIVILLLFSFISRKILRDEMRAKLELEDYKTELENKVEERTREIHIRNEELLKEIVIRKKVEEELQQLAITDPLTGIYNRRMFHQLLEGEIERDRRYRSGLGLILCDLDHFKIINDNFGHDVGDKVLQVFAANTRKHLRDSDILARWGGEEFIILIPQTNLEKTLVIAEKLQSETEIITLPPVGCFTCSFGVTFFCDDDTVESFIKRADDALYLAKRNGRNRVEMLLKDAVA